MGNKTRYNHAFDVAFSLESNDPDGLDVTRTQLIEAMLRRIADLSESDELFEAIGAPFDTHEVDPMPTPTNYDHYLRRMLSPTLTLTSLRDLVAECNRAGLRNELTKTEITALRAVYRTRFDSLTITK